jgi:hypothetical protein
MLMPISLAMAIAAQANLPCRLRSLFRIDAQRLGGRGNLGTLLVDCGSEFDRATGLRICPVAASRVAMIPSAATARTSAAMRSRSSFGMPGGPSKPTRPSAVSAG